MNLIEGQMVAGVKLELLSLSSIPVGRGRVLYWNANV